jgi:nucleotide-binding universal stress UspA family protein
LELLMKPYSQSSYWNAANDFQRARFVAKMEQILARVTRKSVDLLSYDEVYSSLHAKNTAYRGLKEIPVDAIVGSVGRYADFSRSFLPRQDTIQSRWIGVYMMANGLEGLPPIEVYQVGSAYFVKDGHHRVSVARQMKIASIEGYVTEVKTKVPITPETNIEELILKSEFVDFLEKTRKEECCPGADFSVSAAGQYEKLIEHIDVHHYFMGLDEQRDIPYADAVKHWFEVVYLPLAQTIEVYGLLNEFPERTVTDLYLWVMENRIQFQESLGWNIDIKEAAATMGESMSLRPLKILARIRDRLVDLLTPDAIESGPPPGQWRTSWLERIDYKVLFYQTMVPLRGDEESWQAMEQAIMIAKREGGKLRGLHVVSTKKALTAPQTIELRKRFRSMCEEAGVEGDLSIEVGKIARTICERSQWVDLIVVRLTYPPELQSLAKLTSGFHTMLNRCGRPILAVPGDVCEPQRALLAYDGSPKAREALFVAAYLSGHWELPLKVFSVARSGQDMAAILDDAEDYLKSRGVAAEFELHSPDAVGRQSAGEAILDAAKSSSSNLIIMGGYGANPLVEVVVGSVVDHVLKHSSCPVLICR